MAKPNYQFEKRQRELEKKRKQEEKRLRDLAARSSPPVGGLEDSTERPESSGADDPHTAT